MLVTLKTLEKISFIAAKIRIFTPKKKRKKIQNSKFEKKKIVADYRFYFQFDDFFSTNKIFRYLFCSNKTMC